MIPYASRTGTRRNLAALRAAGWRLLVSAKGVHRTEGFPYAIDNGAWTAHQQGHAFDVPAFETVIDKLGRGADWIVAPDIVGGGAASLALSIQWIDRLRPIAPVLIAVQDGMQTGDVEPYLEGGCGIFLGGSTDWKLATLDEWGRVARRRGCYFHVARVNTVNRIIRCRDAGAQSFDGSSATKFVKSLPRLDNAVKQTPLFDMVDAERECHECNRSNIHVDAADGSQTCVDCGAALTPGIYA